MDRQAELTAHDFQWAVSQLLVYKPVRRITWDPSGRLPRTATLHRSGTGILARWSGGSCPWTPQIPDLTATDWTEG